MMKRKFLFILMSVFLCFSMPNLVLAQDEQTAGQLADKVAILIQKGEAEEVIEDDQGEK